MTPKERLGRFLAWPPVRGMVEHVRVSVTDPDIFWPTLMIILTVVWATVVPKFLLECTTGWGGDCPSVGRRVEPGPLP